MIKRCSTLLLVLLSLAPLSFARIISYAPYTDQAALRADGVRAARYFVLLEGPAGYVSLNSVGRGQAVLYDATGVEEPRVIYPVDGGVSDFSSAAIYQSGPTAPPVILITVHESLGPNLPAIQTMTKISVDGGQTWRRINELDGKNVHPNIVGDIGGPWTRGMASPIRIGNENYPFVVSYVAGAYAIPRTGAPVYLGGDSAVLAMVGQNREGTLYILRPTPTTLVISDLTGAKTPLGDAEMSSRYYGWITSDKSAYVVQERVDGRFLWLYRNGQKTFVAGPHGSNGTFSGFYHHAMAFFAVPTYDFEGAWMIQRDNGKPTNLLRHTALGTLETMWSDITGPEVEALHAGSSGRTLLVQVHRERPVQQTPFRDPALAVWKVGEPAPRAYDELFLNESVLKGFVHVDAETIGAGAPFVFDSGSVTFAPDIITSPPPAAGGGDVIQEWGVVRASLKQRLVLPGVARLPGAFNSFWQTDVVIYNPLEEPQAVDVQFVALGEEITIAAANTVRLTLAANEIRVVNDSLKTLFNLENAGGALYFSPAQGMTITGRTYSKAAGGNGGTFGYGMLAIDFWNAAGPRFPLSFAGAFPAANFRTNLLLTDTSGRGTEARLQAYGVSGTMGSSEIAFAAPTNGVAQTNNVGSTLGLASHQTGGLVVQPSRGTVIPVVVAIDNRTNDPTYFPPDLPASMIRTIPVIGHVDGANGSRFRSDLYLLNLSTTPRSVFLEMKKWDTNEFARQMSFTLLPNEARVIDDVLMKLWGVQGLARLRYWSDGAGGDATGVRVTSRTYTIDNSGATYGCLIPPLNSFQSATAGEALEILGVVGGSGFRANLGLVELTAQPNNLTTNVRISIFDQSGKQIDRFTVGIPAAGGMQINDLFGARSLTAPAAARIVVEVLDATGLVGAYATLTDNVTNDSTFLGANLGARPQ